MRSPDDEIPAGAAGIVGAWLAAHDAVDATLVEGLYLVGSLALGDWRDSSDIDIVGVVADPADPETVELLAAVHAALPDDVRARVDGPVVGWGDLTTPAMTVQRPWSLHGEFFHDAECFELNPVTWYVLATAGIAVRGDDPRTLEIPTPLEERRLWVRENVDTYWRGLGGSVRDVLAEEPDRDSFDPVVLEWCVLGPARMLYTWVTGDVASKTDVGRWAAEQAPWAAELLSAAEAARDTPMPVDRGTAEHSVDWIV